MHGQQQRGAIAILFDFTRHYGSRSNKTHFALEDVNQLRKLIKTRLAQYPAEWSYTGVFTFWQLIVVLHVFAIKLFIPLQDTFRIAPHSPELLYIYPPTILAEPLLSE